MATGELHETLLSKRLALPIFASDALSSVAYATEAALLVLVTASLASRTLIVPLSIAIAALLAIVVLSYRQTIYAYPNGGGSYVVASENLGRPAGLVAGSSLLVDYVLTVAVSVVSGVIAVNSAVPALAPYKLEVSIACVGLLLAANLRGVRESGRLFAAPTYVFIFSLGLAIVVGLAHLLIGDLPKAHAPDALPAGAASSIGLLVLLRAFASGCSALTGVEAVSNGVTAFRNPQPRNAARTLMIMAGIAIFLFMGTSILARATDARPSSSVSVLSEVVRAAFPASSWTSPGFYVVQIATFAVLVLAANTAFQGFPRLSALLAQDDFLPRQFSNLGDRLVYSNGMVVLAGAAALLIAIFDANIDRLIQLYLVGVFTAFTLSQLGMLRRGRRLRAVGTKVSAGSLAMSGLGACATGLVLVIVVLTKFREGAWMVTIAIPVLVALCAFTYRHYVAIEKVLEQRSRTRPRTSDTGPVIVVVESLDEATADAVDLVRRLAPGGFQALHLRRRGHPAIPQAEWRTFAGADAPPLQVLDRPLGAAAALAQHVRARRGGPDRYVTVVIPELFRRRSLLSALRRRTFSVKLRLLAEQQVVVANVAALDGDALAPVEHVVAVHLVSRVSLPTLRALDYARTLAVDETVAVSVSLDEAGDSPVAREWREAGLRVPLTVLQAPYRDLGAPVLDLVRSYTADPATRCLVIMPELVVRRRFQRLLHNQRAFFLKRLLLFEPRVDVVSVPYHITSSA
jgi:amino acid transporter